MPSEHNTETARRLCIVYGGRSGEHDVSIRSAISVDGALDRAKYEVGYIGITKDGGWVPGVAPVGFAEAADGVDTARAIEFLRGFDVAFPVLHGPYGEDGTIQGLFEMLDLPYVGAGVLGSALAMNKAVAKKLFAHHGLPIVPHVEVKRRDWIAAPGPALERIIAEIGLPCFIKPANLGSSVGITKAHDDAELCRGIDLAADYDRTILVEQAVDAREIECSILGNDAPEASVCGEIVPCNEWYDYEAKYIDGRSELIIQAPIDDAQQAHIQRIAVEAFRLLDCCGMARADFLLCKQTGAVYLNELNSIPGFTTISMYPKLWQAGGLPYPVLLDRLVELGLDRHRERTTHPTLHATENA